MPEITIEEVQANPEKYIAIRLMVASTCSGRGPAMVCTGFIERQNNDKNAENIASMCKAFGEKACEELKANGWK